MPMHNITVKGLCWLETSRTQNPKPQGELHERHIHLLVLYYAQYMHDSFYKSVKKWRPHCSLDVLLGHLYIGIAIPKMHQGADASVKFWLL